jgi:aminoglycoside phosphotransferase (APT) family kinase protein
MSKLPGNGGNQHLAISRVPLDPAIPTLSAALDPVKLAKEISSLPPSRWPWGAPEEVTVEVLRWRPASHCAFKIVVRTMSGSYPLIGKVYAGEAQNVYQMMERLWRSGFDRGAEASVPEPIAYLPSLRLLLQEKVEGLEAKKIFKYGDEGLRAAAAERCGRWLACFHSLAPRPNQITDVERILARTERAHWVVSQDDRPLAGKSEQLLERIKRAASNLGSGPMCASHGDFGSYHVLFAEKRTVTFDWDLYDLADPARDVARFIVSLERQALHRLGGIRALDGAASVFLQTYLASGGSPVATRLPFYKAAHCLKGAAWEVRTKALEWRAWAEAMLDEGLYTLELPARGETAPVRPQLQC